MTGWFSLLAGCSSTQSAYEADGYRILFGVMSHGLDNRYHVYAETTQIHRLADRLYAHGFEVARRDGNRFLANYEIRFPEPMKTIPEEMRKTHNIKEGGRVIESLPQLYMGIYAQPFFFSPDDPLGTYQLTVYVDNEVARVINYDVIPFGKEEAITF